MTFGCQGQIQHAVANVTFMKKTRANGQNRILVHIENSSFERNLQLGEVLGLL